eukprot:gene371-56_t
MAEIAVGIDVASSASFIAYVGKRGTDIILNESSKRSTASMVSFDDTCRLVGEKALEKVKSNLTGTVRNFKQILGRTLKCQDELREELERLCEFIQSATVPGYVAVKVDTHGASQEYTVQQVFAMLIYRLDKQAERETGHHISGVVLSCPSHFADVHRQAMLDACAIAEVKCLRLFQETSAIAMSYAYPRRRELPPREHVELGRMAERVVMFVSLGHSALQVCVCAFSDSGASMVAEGHSQIVSGRNMDWIIMEMLEKKFSAKYGKTFDLSGPTLQDRKAKFKLEAAAMKCKKTLSTNTEARVAVDCLTGDNDLDESIDRKEFEDRCEHMKRTVHAVVEKVRRLAGIQRPDDIHAIEMVGGAARVPWFKQAISEMLGDKKLSYTLNAEECIAMGCAYEAALRSHRYSTQPYELIDYVPRTFARMWENKKKAEGFKSQMLFKHDPKHVRVKIHSHQPRSFCRSGAFTVLGNYGQGSDIPDGTEAEFASYLVNVPSFATKHNIKVRVMVDLHGCFKTVGPAHVVVEEPSEQWGAAENAKEKKEPYEIIITIRGALSAEGMQMAKQTEHALRDQENQVIAAQDARNDLEKFIIQGQAKMTDGNSDFGRPGEVENFRKLLDDADSWMWDGNTRAAEQYLGKLAELEQQMGHVLSRILEFEGRHEAQQELHKVCDKWKSRMEQEPNFDGQMQNLKDACQIARQKVDQAVAQSDGMRKDQNPTVTMKEIRDEADRLDRLGAEIAWSTSTAASKTNSRAPSESNYSSVYRS